jgi:hypothetical protein
MHALASTDVKVVETYSVLVHTGQSGSVTRTLRARNILSGVIATNITTQHFPSTSDLAHYMIRLNCHSNLQLRATTCKICDNILFF